MEGVRESEIEREKKDQTSIIGALSIDVKGFFFNTAKGVDLTMNIIGSRRRLSHVGLDVRILSLY